MKTFAITVSSIQAKSTQLQAVDQRWGAFCLSLCLTALASGASTVTCWVNAIFSCSISRALYIWHAVPYFKNQEMRIFFLNVKNLIHLKVSVQPLELELLLVPPLVTAERRIIESFRTSQSTWSLGLNNIVSHSLIILLP